VPDWNRDTSEYEVRRVPRYFRNSRLVDVAKVHYTLSPIIK
jgi:hypothetical protein